MCVPPGTAILAFAVCEIEPSAGAVAFPASAEAAPADEPAGCADAAPVDGSADGEVAAGFCPAGFCDGGCAAGAGGNGPSCCANAEPVGPRNAKRTTPANCRRSEPFLMCCPQYYLAK